jgi:hypothetical protein
VWEFSQARLAEWTLSNLVVEFVEEYNSDPPTARETEKRPLTPCRPQTTSARRASMLWN